MKEFQLTPGGNEDRLDFQQKHFKFFKVLFPNNTKNFFLSKTIIKKKSYTGLSIKLSPVFFLFLTNKKLSQTKVN